MYVTCRTIEAASAAPKYALLTSMMQPPNDAVQELSERLQQSMTAKPETDELSSALATIEYLRNELAAISLKALTYQVGENPIEILLKIHKHAKELSKTT